MQHKIHDGVWLPRAGKIEELVAFGDSDWANDKITRKSVSAGVLVFGDCILFDYARSQAVPARSSGEAERYSQVTLASEALYMSQVLKFLFNVDVRVKLMTDSTSAKAIGARQGVGKLRHLEVGTLWLQNKIEQKLITMGKVGTEVNLR